MLPVSLLPQAIDKLKENRISSMQYTVVFGKRNKGEVRAAEAPTALEALAVIGVLQRSGEEVKFIRSRQEGEIGVEMLRVLAKEEEEELPVAVGQ
jgi:hypothetical protein